MAVVVVQHAPEETAPTVSRVLAAAGVHPDGPAGGRFLARAS
ncbi:hypothetical protein ABZY83_06155 [Streptomyces virginiae]|nr:MULTISPECIES: hypothetical protein [unclassified Streptomyces]